MNTQLIEKLRAANLTQAQMKELSVRALVRCAGNTSSMAAGYAKQAENWASQIAAKGFYALQASLNFCEASTREQTWINVQEDEEKWLTGELRRITDPARSSSTTA